jgi:AcrR family transcriptional regulator
VLRGSLGRRDHEAADSGVIKRPNLLCGEDLLPGPQQKRSLDTRARLKAAAISLFGEKGYEGASIEEIALRADIAVGGFYQHFRSKRQLLLALMNELLEKLGEMDVRPTAASNVRAGLRKFLSRAFDTDLRYLGAYRAWQEALLSDAGLARKQREIQAWTTARVTGAFKLLQQLPGARPGVDIPGIARAMDFFFWSLLAQAHHLSEAELDRWLDSGTHLIYHALFTDPPGRGKTN